MTDQLPISRRQFSRILATGVAATTVAACDGSRDGGNNKSPGGLTAQGKRKELNCFSFHFRNDQEEPIYDVHIPLDGDAVLGTPPPGWEFDGEGGVTFRTPPANPGGGTAERPRPVPPGGLSGRFTFYLDGDGPTTGGPVELSFEDPERERVPVNDIWQGGKLVLPGPDGLKHISRSDKAYCRELEITAPEGQEVKDVHLERLPGGNPTDFVDVEPPEGWVSNPVDSNSVTIFTEGDGPGVADGGKLTFRVCFKSPNARASWRLTDGRNQTIPGSEGRIDL